MSVNTANTPDGEGILIFNGEVIHLFTPNVCFTFEKNNNEGLVGDKYGQLFLTSHRIIFRQSPPKDNLISFEMPFACLSDVKLEQPIFGSNYLHGIATAYAGSTVGGEIPWRITFSKGGCIEFGTSLLQAVSRCTRPSNAPPPYAPPAGAFFSAPPDYYAPERGSGFSPMASAFPERPAPSEIFVHEAPPPYPGVEERNPQPTEELVRAGNNEPPPPYAEGLRNRRR